ncbi:CDP-glycerol glycerophosphotransferase family protein [Actinomyces respiraculi]|uniref:CDP-glycerol glycerophosphotransferase family protein n=1 Tax=Actinomyces respiraculi TaxID=2744574 RepID=UPI001423D681|nr:CDP-glycerol glycerophosphotransferase family protein [Actinomyces respiraculi]
MSSARLQVLVVDDGGGDLDATRASLAAEGAQETALVLTPAEVPSVVSQLRGGRLLVLRAGDQLEPGFAVSLSSSGRAGTVFTRLLRAPEPGRGGQATDDHPLAARFMHGSRATNLRAEPHLFTSGLAGAVLVVPNAGLPAWDPADSAGSSLLIRHLAAHRDRLLLHDGPGVVLRFPGEPRPFSRFEDYQQTLASDVPSWLAAARQCGGGQVRSWVWQLVLRQLVEVTDADRGLRFVARGLDDDGRAWVVSRLRQLLKQVGVQPVQEYCASPLALNRRAALLAAAGGGCEVMPPAVLASERAFRPDRKVSYFFTGEPPVEEWMVDGTIVEPTCVKTVSHRYFDQVLVQERVVWLPKGHVTARLDGRAVKVAPFSGMLKPPPPRPSGVVRARRYVGRSARALRLVAARPWAVAFSRVRRTKGPESQAADSTVLTTVTTGAGRAQARIWLYLDRHDAAGDNAEPLYRFACERAPQVRHLFALERDSSDWERLSAAGFELVEIGTAAFDQAWVQAESLLLADIGDPVVAPRLVGNGTRRDQRVVFLQHGVTMRDMWRWFNIQRIDVLVTATPAETRGIVADYTSYELTGREVWPSGFPRHDTLFKLLGQQRDRVVLAPTWNPSLVRALEAGMAAEQDIDGLYEPWLELAEQLRGRGLRPVLFAHPKLALLAPGWFSALQVETTTGRAVPQDLSRAWAVVSDRSSIMDEGMLLGAVGVVWDPLGQPDTDHYRRRHVEAGALAAGSAGEVLGLVERVVSGEVRPAEDMTLRDARACERLLERLLREMV